MVGNYKIKIKPDPKLSGSNRSQVVVCQPATYQLGVRLFYLEGGYMEDYRVTITEEQLTALEEAIESWGKRGNGAFTREEKIVYPILDEIIGNI